MQIKIDVGAVHAGIPDDICEIRGRVGQTGIALLLVARPKAGDFGGKVVVFNLGQALVEVLDPGIKEHAETIERIKSIPPASIGMSSIEDAEYVIPEVAEPGRIIPVRGTPEIR